MWRWGFRWRKSLGSYSVHLEGWGDSGGLAEDGETDLHTVPRACLGLAVTCVKAQAAGLRFAPATIISAQEGVGFTRLGLQ